MRHAAFHTDGAQGIPILRRVLIAISMFPIGTSLNFVNSFLTVVLGNALMSGYCQAMAAVTASLLLMADEETSYKLAIRLFNQIALDYYSETMEGLQVDLAVFSDLFKQHFPNLQKHFDSFKYDISTLCTRWFMCFFLGEMPWLTVLRIWDYLFLHGTSALVITSLAFFKLHQKELLAKKEFFEVHQYIADALLITTNWTALVSAIESFSFSQVKKLKEKKAPLMKIEFDKCAINRVKVATKLTIPQIEGLREKFNALAIHGAISREYFTTVVTQYLCDLSHDQELLDSVIDRFDTNFDGRSLFFCSRWLANEAFSGNINWKEYCVGLSILAVGNSADKIKFCFQTFDVDHDGTSTFLLSRTYSFRQD